MSAVRLGRKLSEEHRANLSAASLGRVTSEETKAKFSASSPNCIKIEVTDRVTNIVTIYPSFCLAAKALNIPSSIFYCIF